MQINSASSYYIATNFTIKLNEKEVIIVEDDPLAVARHEAKVKVDSLQPLGNITADEAKQKLSYEDIMRTNLDKLENALECK